MSLGSLLLRFRQRFGKGLRVAYWRDVARPRILKTRPVSATGDGACEIHVMTSREDWLNLVWALKSFYWASGKQYRLCVHDDGTLSAEGTNALREHFPGARIIGRAESDARMRSALAGFPNCLQFRFSNLLAPKVFDFPAYLESERMLLLDSDVLFFRRPDALLGAIDDPGYRMNRFNPDSGSWYTVPPGRVGTDPPFELKNSINSGLALVHRASLRLDWIEEFLQLPTILDGHFWRIEQTLYALCSSRFGVELLPEEYRVRTQGGIDGCPVRHYVGAIRHLMYREGMRELVRRGMLRDLA
jgi:hypothetical protein